MVGIPDIAGSIQKGVEDAASAVGLSSKSVVRKAMSSSWIAFAEYDPNDLSLDITTQRGATFSHYGVPEEVAQQFFDAPSPGSFWHLFLKDAY